MGTERLGEKDNKMKNVIICSETASAAVTDGGWWHPSFVLTGTSVREQAATFPRMGLASGQTLQRPSWLSMRIAVGTVLTTGYKTG